MITMEERMKQAYELVRRELGVAADRMKRRYDIDTNRGCGVVWSASSAYPLF